MQHFPIHFILFPLLFTKVFFFIRRLPGIDAISTAQDLNFYLSAINLPLSFFIPKQYLIKLLLMISFVILRFI